MSEEIKHYGVKGMKWGVIRKAGSAVVAADKKRVAAAKEMNSKMAGGVKKAGSSIKSKYDSITPEQKKAIKSGVATGAATALATAIAVGSAITARQGMTPTRDIPNISADKIDNYLMQRRVFSNDAGTESALLANYSKQVRRGDY